MKQYSEPDLSLIPVFENHPALTQYFFDDHALTAVANHTPLCGYATDDHEFFMCLSGTEDVSSELVGLTVISSSNVENTIISCSVGGDFGCSSGIGYTCQVGSPGYSEETCITTVTDNNGHSTTCNAGCILN